MIDEFDPKNYKRCVGQCHRLRPIRDFQIPRNKVCLECRGLMRKPDGSIAQLPPPARAAPKFKRANAAKYPLDIAIGYRRYQRERAQERREKQRIAQGLPPAFRPPWGSRCAEHLGGCGIFKGRSEFDGANRLCRECDAKELQQIQQIINSRS